MLLLDILTIRTLIQRVGLIPFFLLLNKQLKEDFSHWNDFQKSPRHAVYVPNGVIELMPICNTDYYAFKYVNGHPDNPLQNKLNVVAFGALADVHTGYPLLIAEMTLITALRTAATSALASELLARKDSHCLAMIGCGAQSEFQVLAHQALFDLKGVRYFDPDAQAMQRFAAHVKQEPFRLEPMPNVLEAIKGADIIITATAARGRHHVIRREWLHSGQHISGIGGDSPGKTELDPEILNIAKIVVEYLPQTRHEGEIQNLVGEPQEQVYAELWEIIAGHKMGRETPQEITLFDSVGFALEDFSILRLCYDLARQEHLGTPIDLIPHRLTDCKDLYGLLSGASA